MVDIVSSLGELEEGVNRFVAENAKPRSHDDLKRLYGRKELSAFLKFVEVELKITLADAQVRIAEAIIHHNRVAVYSNNGFGKDFVAALILLWWVVCLDGYGVVMGASERTVRQATMRYLRRAYYAGNMPGQLYELSLRVDGEDRLLAFSSNSVDRAQGLHDRDMLIVITEAQGVEDFVYEAVDALTTGETAKVLLLGNPLRPQGKFYENCTSGRWHAIGLSAFDHPNVIEGSEVFPGAVTRGWIEHMKAEYGEDSPVYIARVLGRFPEASIDSLYERAWLLDAAERFESGELDGKAMGEDVVLALDVARYGADASSLAVVQGPVVREIMSWRDTDLVMTARRFKLEGERYTDVWQKRPFMVVDAHGMGSSVVDNLKHWGWHAREFYGWSPAREPKKFINQRAESYFQLREALRNGRIALPRNETLFQELLATTWFLNTRGQIQLEGKDEIKAGLGRSPDLADAVTMAFYHTTNSRRAGVIPWRV